MPSGVDTVENTICYFTEMLGILNTSRKQQEYFLEL